MKNILTMCFIFVLSACSTMTGTQADCFSKNQKFSDAASCMRNQMDSLRWGSNAPMSLLRDYQLYLNSLESKVNKNQLSDEDAKMQMQEYLIRLRNSYN